MISRIENLPANMVGFRASGDVTEKDFSEVVMPEVQKIINKTGKLNYMLVLDTSVKNFTPGAWLKDAAMGIKHLTKWHRAAIVSDVESIRKFTDIFSLFMPGEFRGFTHEEVAKAITWTSGDGDIHSS